MTFKPGVSGNPAGRPKGDGSLAKLRELSGKAFREVFFRYLKCTKKEIDEALEDESLPAIERMMILAIQKALNPKNQNNDHFSFLLDRMIGKVPDKVETSNINANLNVDMSDEDLLEKVKEKIMEIEARKPTE